MIYSNYDYMYYVISSTPILSTIISSAPVSSIRFHFIGQVSKEFIENGQFFKDFLTLDRNLCYLFMTPDLKLYSGRARRVLKR